MKNLFAARKYFIRQSGPDDCGLACVCMILNYCGRTSDADQLFAGTNVPAAGFSLLALKKLSAAAALSSDCVSVDKEALRKISQPLILYLLNDRGEGHFSVCFGAVKRDGVFSYLIGDPAADVFFLPEPRLLEIWPKGAALYFENIKEGRFKLAGNIFVSLLNIRSFRRTLLITVPFLNICSTLLGIALSWLLQRGISDPFQERRTSLLAAIIILLLIITLFKSLLNFIRQRVLISLNNSLSDQFNRDFIYGIVSRRHFINKGIKGVRNGLADIQKIRDAVSAFVAVLFSDGSIVVFIVAGIWYAMPKAGICDTFYLGAMLGFTALRMPEMSYHAARLSELSGRLENELSHEHTSDYGKSEQGGRLEMHLSNHSRYTDYARSVAVRISVQNLIFEMIGTVNVILVLIFCLSAVQRSEMSYGGLMAIVILSYFITALMPKISNAWTVVSEGAALIRRYQITEPNS